MTSPYSPYTTQPSKMATQGGVESEISSQESLIYTTESFGSYNPDSLVGKKGLRIYEQMMLDEQVKASMTVRKFSRLSTGWDILPGDPEDKFSMMLRDYAEEQTMRTAGTFYDSLLGIMTAKEFGYSITEIVKDYIEKGDFKGKTGLHALKTREPYGYDFQTDVHGNLEGILFGSYGLPTNGWGSPEKPLPPDRFVIYSNNKQFSNWYGISELRPVYRPWFSKDYIIKFLNIYLERYGSPTIMAEVPGNASDPVKTKVDALIKNIQSKGAFRVPEGVVVSLLEATRAGHAGYDKAIGMYNTMISRGIMIPELMGYSDRLSGSQSLGEVQFDVFIWVLEKDGIDIQETVVEEQIFKSLIDDNWEVKDNKQYPLFRLKTLKEENVESRAKVLDILVERGVVDANEEWVREYLLLPKWEKPGPGAKPIKEPEPEPAPPQDPQNPGEEKKPGDEDENEPKMNVETYALNREPSVLEQKVGFTKLAQELAAADTMLRDALIPIFIKQRDKLLRDIERNKVIQNEDWKFIDKMQLAYVGKVKTTLQYSEVKLHLDNKLATYVEIGKGGVEITVVNKFADAEDMPFQPWTPIPPTQAVEQFNDKVLATIVTEEGTKKVVTIGKMKELAYYDSRAFAISGIERDYILKEAKLILQTGIKQGLATKDIMEQLRSMYDKYIPTGEIVGGKPVTAARLETIVRTNVSDAINQGRKAMMNDPLVGGFVPYVMWSSVLDSRTSEYCESMDARTFKKNDPLLDEPPAHFNCFPAATRITTKDKSTTHEHRSSKMIKRVKPGDYVLTHNGVFREVTKKFEREYSGDLVEIEMESGEILRATPNHPVFVDGRGWVRADELTEKDSLVREDKRIQYKVNEVLIQVGDAVAEDYRSGKGFRFIMNKYGIIQDRIKDILRRHDVPIRHGSEAVKTQWIDNPKRRASIAELFAQEKKKPGYVHPMLGKKHPVAKKRMTENNPMNDPATRAKAAASLKGMFAGKKNPMYGRAPGHGKWCKVDTPLQGTVKMRSSYEKIFAEFHNLNGDEYLYEPRRFKLGEDTTYLPDFLMMEDGVYIEVKGWVKEKDLEKLRLFNEYFPDLEIKMVCREEIEEMERYVVAHKEN